MKIYPAIDLKDGKCVRLYQGDFQQQTVVNEDPLQQALLFVKGGIEYLHVVDLDGALAGKAINASLIAEIKKVTGISLQVGGGIRTLEQVKAYSQAGIDRIIIGSAALKDPDFVKQATAIYGDKIAVGIDAKDGKVAVSGWLDVSSTDYLTFAKKMEGIGVQTIIYTDIARDGTLAGPNLSQYKALSEQVDVNLIASGGVGNVEDLRALAKLGLAGTIVGKAYYNGNVSLEEMLEVEQLC